jgi:predicted DNA-binding transcriptional regulator AlpA
MPAQNKRDTLLGGAALGVIQDYGLPVDRLLPEQEAAQILGVSVRTLQAHRLHGTGPKFVKISRAVRYRLSDLEAFIDENTVLSTTEVTARRRAQ